MIFSKAALLAVSSAFAYCQAAQEATAPEDSAVVRLTGETFESYLKEAPLVLAEFYAPWCGHCKSLVPQYVKAAEQLQSKNISLVQIDCTEEKELCANQSIMGFPTLKVFKEGNIQQPVDYVGDRSSDAIVSFMLKQAQPPVTVLEGDDAAASLKDLIKEQDAPVIVDGGFSDLNVTFYELAEAHRRDYTFVQYAEGDGKLSIYLPGEEEPIVFDETEKDFDHLSKWIKIQSIPFFGDVDATTFQAYLSSELPLAFFFYTSPEERAEYEQSFKDLSKKYRGKINICGLDSAKYGKHALNLNMREQFPLFVIHNTTSGYKYGMPQLLAKEFEALEEPYKLDKKEVSKFVEDFLGGKVEPVVKSEAVPETQENSVYRLVGKTHDEIINDPTKDVLVKYYAPWCGHCNRLAPIFEDLAGVYEDDAETKDKILVANLDATLNDVFNVEIEHFPTIVLYPAAKDAKPIYYEGDRSLDSFFDFIKENGANSLDGKAIHERMIAEMKDAEIKIQDDEEEEEEEEVSHDEL